MYCTVFEQVSCLWIRMQWEILNAIICTHRFLPKPATVEEKAEQSFLPHGPVALRCQGQTVLPAGEQWEG